MTSRFEEIVQESSEFVQNTFFSQEYFDSRMLDARDEFGDVDLEKVFSLVIEVCSGYSSTVLAETLERLAAEGYLKSDN
ncbi:TPA: hypothetical protein O9547_001373 [Staphylococcus aureus]|uniref:Uncharacterized protein n=1 Tax=Staphylococcus coagulans TaxID=74706 RepID=A0A9X0TPF5_9STAP|nr:MULTISPECIES: hypothetical protein [Staphylococcus]HDD0308104.1 hypothetical protein [Staphylococcus aureus]MBA8777501.1 hypothetical protein [Staphylococcus coagulans]MDY3696909.1 hypothetical protein [Staphylococcus hyicus]HDD0311566.1 hypothetical protein [Staphylococcus aureus]HDD0314266.1 hypothetical protein [Staphylococcus aureus]